MENLTHTQGILKEEAEIIKRVYMNRWQSGGPNGMIQSQTLLSATGSCDET